MENVKSLQALAQDLEQVVFKAAIATKDFIGSGEKEAGDQAAVDAMRDAFDDIDVNGIVQVGEGEKDEAPMLYIGEQVGNGRGLDIDIAVDPVEGTTLMAEGLPNAIAVLSAAPQGSFWRAGSAYYMDKIVVGPKAKDAIDINLSVADNLSSIAMALGKQLNELTVYVLDKPRHQQLITEIESLGAKVDRHSDGDVIGSILALLPDSDIDVLMGIGGAPEAVITASAVKALGGGMQGKLAPQKEIEKARLLAEAVDLDRVLYLDDLVKSDWSIFAAAGVTSGLMLKGVAEQDGKLQSECLIIGPGQEVKRKVQVL